MSVVQCCWACKGAGYRLRSLSPITFKRCWMCYGRRGRVALVEVAP